MKVLERKTGILILLLGLLQGIALLAAYEFRNVWPWTSLKFSVPWHAVWILVPVALQLIALNIRDKRTILTAVVMGLLFTALGRYAGASFEESTGSDVGLLPFEATMCLAWFISLPYIQTSLSQRRLKFPYDELFLHSWSNATVLVSATVFTGVFWLVLLLWQALFNVINIDIFKNIFKNRLFIYTATPVAFAAAVALARHQLSPVEALKKNTLRILKTFLPVVLCLSIAFLFALPFTGLEPLWKTGHATALMLILQLGTVLFLNAAYLDGKGDAPYGPVLRRIIRISLLAMPVYTGLCMHALGLRVGQYGWTAGRVWAALAVFTAGMYALGYAISALAPGGPWMKRMGCANTVIAAVIALTALAANTPILDPLRIAAQSQLKRLIAGKVEPAQFDFDYLRFRLGKRGLDALKKLSVLEGHPNAADIKILAAASLAKQNRCQQRSIAAKGPDEISRYFDFYPANTAGDMEFLKFIFERKERYLSSDFTTGQKSIILSADLNKDGKDEKIIFGQYVSIFFFKSASGWRNAGQIKRHANNINNLTEIGESLKKGNFKTAAPEWQDLQIGGNKYSVIDNYLE